MSDTLVQHKEGIHRRAKALQWKEGPDSLRLPLQLLQQQHRGPHMEAQADKALQPCEGNSFGDDMTNM